MYDLHSILIQLKKEDTPLHGVMVRCVRCFYQWLDPTLWEGSALFELWAQELELIYGDLRQRLSPNAKTDAGSLGDRFGFDTPPELPRLLQSIQSFYSVLIKLIAWNTLRGATPEPPLTELLSGRASCRRFLQNQKRFGHFSCPEAFLMYLVFILRRSVRPASSAFWPGGF